MKDLYIVGAGGFGREVLWLVQRINEKNEEWAVKGFLDDTPAMHGKILNDYQVLGSIELLKDLNEVYVACAIGSSKVRERVIDNIRKINPSVKFATLVDPSVIKSETVKIGEGSIICAGTIITVNIDIGRHNIINLDCTIGHDAVLADFVTLYPSVNVSGAVTIGNGCECGTGSQLIQGISVCDLAIIGAGAVLVKDIVEAGTYVGVPVKKVK